MIDKDSICFATATCRRDIHYVRCLLASVRYFHPKNPIVVVCDRDITSREQQQLATFPNTSVYSTAELTDKYKLAFRGTLTDLYFLVLQDYRHYLFCDADSVLVGPVLDRLEGEPAFAAFTGKRIDLNNPASRTGFCRFGINLDAPGDLELQFLYELDQPLYFFSSHFYLDRQRFPIQELFDHLPQLDFGLGQTIETPFQRGDQGFFCYVLNKYFVNTDQLLHVPCTPSATPEVIRDRGICVESLKAGLDPQFLHFVGPTRRWTLKAHNGGDLLAFFYRRYWQDSTGTSGLRSLRRLLRTAPSFARRRLQKSH